MKHLVAGFALAGVLAFNPLIGHAELGDQTLEPGMWHEDVKELQEILDEKGYFKYSETTTYYGDYTTDAVKAFQADKDIEVTGTADEETFKALGVESNESNIVEVAKKYEGTPYQWGGETPEEGFDCSGYLNYIFDEAENKDLPRTTKEMYEEGTKVESPAVGDIVFFDVEGNGVSHAGVYIGNGEFYHASSTDGVKVSELDSSYWKDKYIGAKRF
ncbi:putative peptidoglycan endopeptidase LytE precursor [Bacillus sp. THAF10]|uniref:C40 family peptidase n=1 Tax=Bacillus sp. THAF10 TaxID=2587848 RepID=UPI001268F788|nr:NlpC/P60 family protein [Bacillus sp. THAF10]QFT90783.1 putative peptidoglycan endopeptidase LytE precursor [Bacillus sp. THAF10]